MEPITWATTSFETIICGYFYYLLTSKEYSNEDFKSIIVNRRIRKTAARSGLDLKKYEALQEELKQNEALLQHFPDQE